jgi:hypothetical protein
MLLTSSPCGVAPPRGMKKGRGCRRIRRAPVRRSERLWSREAADEFDPQRRRRRLLDCFNVVESHPGSHVTICRGVPYRGADVGS